MAYFLLTLNLAVLILSFYLFFTRNKLKTVLTEKNKLDREIYLLNLEKIALDGVLQAIDDGVIITSIDGNIEMVSKKALDLLKADLSHLKDRPIDSIISVDSTRNKLFTQDETKLSLTTGEVILAKVSSLPILTEGEVRGTIYTIHDITKEKEFEEMKLDFVTMAAHQLRTPLTLLRSYLSVLSGRILTKLKKDDKLYLDRSIQGANQLSSLIENLINITHIENRLSMQIKQLQIASLVTDVVYSLNVIGKEKGIKIKIHKEDSLPLVPGDPYLITQVLNNLIVNAIEHSNKGRNIDISIRNSPNEITVDVKDYGEGIPYEATKHLFEKFYQAPSHLEAGSKGQGLGLYISKKIIEAHKGKIWVNSIQGRGSTFSFSLPAYQIHPPNHLG